MREETHLIAVSGGLFSTTLMWQLARQSARGKVFRIHAVHVDLGTAGSAGQRAAAGAVAAELSVPLDVINARGVGEVIGRVRPPEWVCSDCIGLRCEPRDDSLRECLRRRGGEPDEDIFFHRVPIWLSIVWYYARAAGIKDVYLGHTAESMMEHSVHRSPGELRAFVRQWDAKCRVRLHLPYVRLLDRHVVKRGNNMGLDYSQTFGCFGDYRVHCGDCFGCFLRREAFVNSGVEDPTVYKTETGRAAVGEQNSGEVGCVVVQEGE